MIFVGKCPYRVSLLGGGSDLEWFVEDECFGNSLGFSLAKYSYTVINKKDKNSKIGILNYSSRETYSEIDEIAHPLIRESLRYLKINNLIEMNSYGFASGGGGLGGSSSFCISFLAALNKAFNLNIANKELAHICAEIEINILGKPIGRQDQYISSLGGINALLYKPKGNVEILNLSKNHIDAIKLVSDELILIPSLRTRSADKVLHKFKNSNKAKESLKDIRSICENFLKTNKSTNELYNLLNDSIKESWEIKRKMSNVMDLELENQFNIINQIPNNWIRLIGAGSGGYFLLSSKVVINEALSFLSNKDIKAIKVELSEEGISACEV